jgi:hypothetical protein
MTTHARRFGSFHRYNQPSPSNSFSPTEVDPLLLETISPELSPAKSDKSGEKEHRAIKSDESGETNPNSLTPFEKDFHKNCGKPCGKGEFARYKFLKSLDF